MIKAVILGEGKVQISQGKNLRMDSQQACGSEVTLRIGTHKAFPGNVRGDVTCICYSARHNDS